jgi:hypothetical protein
MPMGSIIWSISGAIASFLLVGVGWFVTNLLAKPYLDFLNLRSQVHEGIVFTANVAPIDVTGPRYREVADSLRRLGAKVLTTNNTESRPLRWYLSWRGYDLVKAGNSLVVLSGCLVDPNPALRIVQTDRIQEGLILPRDSSIEDVREAKEEIHQGRHIDR